MTACENRKLTTGVVIIRLVGEQVDGQDELVLIEGERWALLLAKQVVPFRSPTMERWTKKMYEIVLR